jgi:hypothetical protein
MSRDYVRTARAKGLAESAVLFRHVLKNAMIPILTGAVVVIPLLFMAACCRNRSSASPVSAATPSTPSRRRTFAVVRSMVFIGSVLYIVGLMPHRPLLHAGRSAHQARIAMSFAPVVLATDLLLWLLVAAIAFYAWYCRRRPHLAAPWKRVFQSRAAMITVVVLVCYAVTGSPTPSISGSGSRARKAYSPEVLSVLDLALTGLRERREKTYSAPLATRLYAKEQIEAPDGKVSREFPRLRHGGAHLKAEADAWSDTAAKAGLGLLLAGDSHRSGFLCVRPLRRRWPDVPWRRPRRSGGSDSRHRVCRGVAQPRLITCSEPTR